MTEKQTKDLTLKEAQAWLAERGFHRSLVWLKTMVYKGRIKSKKEYNLRWITTGELTRVMKRKPVLKVVVSALALFFVLSSTGYGAVPQWRGIVIHHTATPNGRAYHVEQCNRDHRARGWDGCGYNFLIQPDGSIETARGFDRIGAHTQGHNSQHLGIAIVGTGQITDQQLASLGRVLEVAAGRFGKLPLYPHRHFKPTECPSLIIWQKVTATYGSK